MIDARGAGPLSASVLVLNRGYAAIQIVGARRAIRLLCCEIAEVIHFERDQFANYDFDAWCELSRRESENKQPDQDWVRSVAFEFRIPRVIRLLDFDRVPRTTVHLNRRSVLARDDFCCQYCGRRLPASQLSLDHVLPRSRGGDNSWENVVCACLKCNVGKGARTPHEAHMHLLRKPAKPVRSPVLLAKLNDPRYDSWRIWVGHAHNYVGVARG